MKKLLLIDDEFIFRQGLKYVMDWENEGYTIVAEASNGKEGFENYLLFQPDIILCDVVMPVLNGIEFVQKLREISNVPIIMLSNFDEYDKVRQAFQYGASDYLLKSQVTKNLLLNCLNRNTNANTSRQKTQSQNYFGRMVRQILDSYSDISSSTFLSWLKLHLPGKQYSLLMFGKPTPDFSSEDDMQECLRQLFPEYPLYACFTTQNHAIALLSIKNQDLADKLPLSIHRLEDKIHHTSCVLGNPFSVISQFRENAENLYDLTRYSILYENQLCFCENELISTPKNPPAFSSELYTKLTSQGQWQDAATLLLEYMDSLKNTPQLNPLKFKKLVEHTFYSSLKDARRQALDSASISRIELKLFKRLDSALNYKHFRSAVQSAYRELEEVCITNTSCDFLIPQLQDFLEKHYAEQITLYDAAQYLHMNYSYLSAYISHNTGKHFRELLNDVRIQHSKTLLSETNLSISRISESIGYSDQSYFGKIFKKQVGITPLQYRNKSHMHNNKQIK